MPYNWLLSLIEMNVGLKAPDNRPLGYSHITRTPRARLLNARPIGCEYIKWRWWRRRLSALSITGITNFCLS
jgi:hypothetical protein